MLVLLIIPILNSDNLLQMMGTCSSDVFFIQSTYMTLLIILTIKLTLMNNVL